MAELHRRRLSALVPDSPLTRQVVALVASWHDGGDLAPTSRKAYATHWRKFTTFCKTIDLDPLTATPDHVELFVGWLATEGRVSANSVPTYLSGINKGFVQLRLARPALGLSLKTTTRALARDQPPRPCEEWAIVAPFPPEEVLTLLQWGLAEVCSAQRMRDALLFNLAFFNGARPATDIQVVESDVVLPPAGQDSRGMGLHQAPSKSRRHRRLVRFNGERSAYVRALTSLFRRWLTTKAAAWEQAAVAAPPGLWWLPGDSQRAAPSTFFQARLGPVIEALGCSPPPGFKFTPYSFRKGCVSNMWACGINKACYNYVCDWAPGSTTPEERYIDFTVARSTAAQYIFASRL